MQFGTVNSGSFLLGSREPTRPSAPRGGMPPARAPPGNILPVFDAARRICGRGQRPQRRGERTAPAPAPLLREPCGGDRPCRSDGAGSAAAGVFRAEQAAGLVRTSDPALRAAGRAFFRFAASGKSRRGARQPIPAACGAPEGAAAVLAESPAFRRRGKRACSQKFEGAAEI